MVSRYLPFLLTAFFSLFFSPVNDELGISSVVIDYQYDQQVVFEANLTPVELLGEIEQIVLQVFPPGSDAISETVLFDETGKLKHQLELTGRAWHPFITVKFSFLIIMHDGQKRSSDTYSFHYEDNRFSWSSLEDRSFQVYWNSDDFQLGQMILNTANSALQSVRTYLPTYPEEAIRIFAYQDAADLNSALHGDYSAWLAGHAIAEQRLVLISTPPGPGLQLELERQIPHEIAHILIHEVSGGQDEHLPLWLTEGIATLSEMYPQTDYQRMLNAAAEDSSLLPMASLCSAFPPGSKELLLAYAQSGSFVNFLYKKYGSSGLVELINTYQDGVSCENGMLGATGSSLSQLEALWQQQVLGVDAGILMLRNLAPYLVLLGCILLVPLLPLLFGKHNNG